MARTQPGTLAFRGPDGAEERIWLEREVTTLGRSETCEVSIPLPTVSRLHARIEIEHERYVLFDAGSANGTFLNGTKVSGPAVLTDGDRIEIGHSVVRFVAR